MSQIISKFKIIAVAIFLFLIPLYSFAQSQSYLDCLAKIESGGSPTAATPSGTYNGLYQLGPGAAATGGICGPGSDGTSWAGCNFSTSTYCVNPPHLCSFSQVFANTPDAIAVQNAAAIKYTNANWDTITRLNPSEAAILNSGGTVTIDGITVTKDTLLAIAHNQGPGAALDFLKGGYTGTDGNGATAQGYGDCINKCMSGDTSKCDLTSLGGACIHP